MLAATLSRDARRLEDPRQERLASVGAAVGLSADPWDEALGADRSAWDVPTVPLVVDVDAAALLVAEYASLMEFEQHRQRAAQGGRVAVNEPASGDTLKVTPDDPATGLVEEHREAVTAV